MTDTRKGNRIAVGVADVRARIASLVWMIAVACAVFLFLGALLIALKANPDNSIRNFLVGGAELFDGPLSRDNGLFTFDGAHAATKSVLVNWGLAGVIYLVVGSILRRVIRPT